MVPPQINIPHLDAQYSSHTQSAEAALQKVVARYGRIVRAQVRCPADGPRRKYMLIEMSSANEVSVLHSQPVTPHYGIRRGHSAFILQALKALAHLHNTLVADSLIKVAFSKLLISDSDPTSSTSSAGGDICRPPADQPTRTATSTASH